MFPFVLIIEIVLPYFLFQMLMFLRVCDNSAA